MLIPEAALICRKDKRSAMASHCQLSMHHSPGTPATVTTFPAGSASCRQSQVSSSRLRSFQRVTTRALARRFASVAEMTARSEEHTSELQSLMRISYAVFCLKKKTKHH